MHILEAKNIYFSYNNGLQILRGVNFKVKSGKIVAVIGPNGAGKTTLFKHFNGLLFPERGSVFVKGKKIRKENLMEIRREIGFLFQNPDDQIIAPTVFQDVAFGPLNFGFDENMIEHNVREALKLVGMEGYENKSPHNLSYGQKKRIAIAGILAYQPSIMILDEPFAGLDPEGVRDFKRLLLKLRKDLGLTVVFSSHDINALLGLVDRVHVMIDGQILLEGKTEEVLSNPSLEKAGLEMPVLFRIYHALIHKGVEIPFPADETEIVENLVRILNDEK